MPYPYHYMGLHSLVSSTPETLFSRPRPLSPPSTATSSRRCGLCCSHENTAAYDVLMRTLHRRTLHVHEKTHQNTARA